MTNAWSMEDSQHCNNKNSFNLGVGMKTLLLVCRFLFLWFLSSWKWKRKNGRSQPVLHGRKPVAILFGHDEQFCLLRSRHLLLRDGPNPSSCLCSLHPRSMAFPSESMPCFIPLPPFLSSLPFSLDPNSIRSSSSYAAWPPHTSSIDWSIDRPRANKARPTHQLTCSASMAAE